MSQSEIEFKLRGLAPVSADECILVLEEVGGSRLLPIHTGAHEAQALALEVSGVARSRPLTHDLLLSVLETVGWTVKRITVSELKDGVFHAKILLEKDGAERVVDARPSDALNVAARARCPIFVAAAVLEEARPIMKPIEKDDLARFREQLDTTDVAAAFAELEGKPAPEEPGAAGPPRG
jgi:bifunctional DNase/RNase